MNGKSFLAIAVSIFMIVSLYGIVNVTYPQNINRLNADGKLQDPDLTYYVINGPFGSGHDLTILISKPLAQINLYLMPLFFFSFFTASIYLFVSNFTKYPQWTFILSPLSILTVVLAQIFSIGFFWLVMYTYYKLKKNNKIYYKIFIPVGLMLMTLAHLWSGTILLTAFTFFVLWDSKKIYLAEISLVILISTILLYNFNPISMLSIDYVKDSISSTQTITTAITRNISLMFSSTLCFGLLIKEKINSLLKLFLPLFVMPFLLVSMLDFDWTDRLVLFMPLLAMSSILLSKLHERIEVKTIPLNTIESSIVR